MSTAMVPVVFDDDRRIERGAMVERDADGRLAAIVFSHEARAVVQRLGGPVHFRLVEVEGSGALEVWVE